MHNQKSMGKTIVCRGIHKRKPNTHGAIRMYCPSCKSTDLKRASLVYQAGRSQFRSRSQRHGFLFGAGGLGLFGGRTATQGVRQTELSQTLRPPLKWSYRKLVLRTALTTAAAFIAYVIFVIVSTPPVSTLPMKLYVFSAPLVFLCLALSIWRHNHSVYPGAFAEWDRSFVCQRCGAVSLHSVPHP